MNNYHPVLFQCSRLTEIIRELVLFYKLIVLFSGITVLHQLSLIIGFTWKYILLLCLFVLLITQVSLATQLTFDTMEAQANYGIGFYKSASNYRNPTERISTGSHPGRYHRRFTGK